MLATCPNNKVHDRFMTMAHVSQEWIVTKHGDFIEDGDPAAGEVVVAPRPENTWTCMYCGAEAKVIRT